MVPLLLLLIVTAALFARKSLHLGQTYNLSFPSVVCSQHDTTANELFNGHLRKGNLIVIDHGLDTKDSEQL